MRQHWRSIDLTENDTFKHIKLNIYIRAQGMLLHPIGFHHKLTMVAGHSQIF